MKFLLTAISLLFSLLLQSQYLRFALSGGGAQQDRIMGVVTNDQGDVFSCGQFRQTVDFDPSSNNLSRSSNGGGDIFVTKHDSIGNLQWVYNAGGNSDVDIGRSITLDQAGNVYVIGWFGDTADFNPNPNRNYDLIASGNSDAFLAKIDPNGNLIWAISFGGNGEIFGMDVVVHPLTGNLLICGKFNGTVDFDPGAGVNSIAGSIGDNIFLSAFTSSGQFLWTNAPKSPNSTAANGNATDLVIGPDGNIYLSGFYFGTLDFNPQGTPFYHSSVNNTTDAFVAIYDINGIRINSKSWGADNDQRAASVGVDAQKNVVVSGYFYGTVDFDPNPSINNIRSSNGSRDIYICQFDSSLNLNWVNTSGNFSAEAAIDVSVAADGKIAMVGYYYSPFDADPDPNRSKMLALRGFGDYFLIEYNQLGQMENAVGIGGGSDDIALSVTKGRGDSYFIGGNFGSTVDFDPSSNQFNLSSNGDQDFYLQHIEFCKDSRSQFTVSGCQQYISPSGKLYNNSGFYFDTIPNAKGCDSIMTINLNLTKLHLNISKVNFLLQVNQNSNASYQWLDCGNGYAPLTGDTLWYYFASQNGSYAVEVTEGNCIDTSACELVNITGNIDRQAADEGIKLFPNPSSAEFHISGIPTKSAEIFQLDGKLIQEVDLTEVDHFNLRAEKGVYFIRIRDQNDQLYLKKIIKQ